MSKTHVAIIGGGLSGLAAAEALSRQSPKTRILLIESKRNLGGRAGSYRDPESGDEVDYCQHVAMGCCTNLIDMLTRCGLIHHLRRFSELTFLHPDYPPSRFAANRVFPAPFHLLGAIFAQRYLNGRQKREIILGLWKLMRTSPSSLGSTSAAEWLDRAGQRSDTRRDFWDVILVSALGDKTDRVSMGAARKVFIDGFAMARGASDVLVPTRPLADLFGRQLADVLRKRGVEILTNQSVRQISPNGEVEFADSMLRPDSVICAVPWYRIERLFENWPTSRRQTLPNLNAFSQIPSSPISGLHLWFDAPITDRDHAVMVGTKAQWIFKDPFQRPDAIPTPSIDSPFETDPRETPNGSHYYQVVISASADAISDSQHDLVESIVAELRNAFPAARTARLVKHRLITDPKSVFSIRPEVEAIRPDSITSIPWLFLAGDWTKTQWPATMEGAVISGRSAAEAVAACDASSHMVDSPHSQRFVCEALKPGFVARQLIRSN